MEPFTIADIQAELDAYGVGGVVENRSRLIVHDESGIYILHKQSGQVEYTEYTPELYHVLCVPSICSYSYDYKKRRINVEIMRPQKSGKRWKNLLGRFIFFWMNNTLPTDEFLQNMPTEENISVDHVNGDKHNHSFWNLSGMSSKDNNRKREYASRIKPPYYCYSLVDSDNKYRVCLGYRNPWRQGQELRYICDTADLLIHFYKSVMKIPNAPGFLHRGETPFLIWKADKNRATAMENWKRARDYADYLLSLSAEDFEPWTKDSHIEANPPFGKGQKR